MTASRQLYQGMLIDEEAQMTLHELCAALQSEPEFVVALVEYEVISPSGWDHESWRFNSLCLRRARLARNFQCDLHVNLSGIHLALDLLDQVERLRIEVDRLQRLL